MTLLCYLLYIQSIKHNIPLIMASNIGKYKLYHEREDTKRHAIPILFWFLDTHFKTHVHKHQDKKKKKQAFQFYTHFMSCFCSFRQQLPEQCFPGELCSSLQAKNRHRSWRQWRPRPGIFDPLPSSRASPSVASVEGESWRRKLRWMTWFWKWKKKKKKVVLGLVLVCLEALNLVVFIEHACFG